jgi:ribosomal protein S27AE
MTLAKTEEAHLEGQEVVGTFCASIPLVISDVVQICEDYANCSAKGSEIVRFTRRYGPVHVAANPGKSFRFPVEEWICWRKIFRDWWRQLAGLAGDPASRDAESKVGFHGHNLFVFSRKENSFETDTLNSLLALCFGAIPRERLRVCAPCGEYFVAHHLKQAYCGKYKCKEWGERKLKLEYWERNKKRFLAERKRGR